MLNKIIQFSIKNKLITGIFILFLIGYGSYQISKLPIDAVPDITNNQVQVLTIVPSLAAPDVERLITFPIEQANSNIAGLKEIRSFSRFGLSVVTIVFDDDVDIYWARQQVNERIQLAQDKIPKEFGKPELAPITTGLGEIYQYCVRAKKGYENKFSAMELRTIQDWIVRRQLIGVKGVADVSSFGGFLKQYEIAVDPAKLKANNISINEIFTALEKNNQNTGGAYIEKGPVALFIRSEGLIVSFDDIKNILIKNLTNGSPLLIRDVAEVRLGHATRFGAMTYNDKNVSEEVSGAVVMMLKGENSNEVIVNIKERIEQIKKTLPEGVVIEPFLDRTKMVSNSINTVSKNLIEGALIVVLVLVLFLGNFRAGFLVASVIPLSLLFAVIMMNLFGVSGNLMSLGALDFGLIVDGAVIIVEAVMHRLTHSKHFNSIKKLTQNEMNDEVEHSASRMMNTAVFGQIIILIVYLPIFTLEGIEGKMFLPMAQTVAFALLGAFILSITYIPMMSSLFLSKNISHKKTFSDKMMAKIVQVYQRILEKAILIPKTIISTSILLFTLSVLVLTQMGGEFIPKLPEGDFAVETRVLLGSNLKTSTDAVSSAAKILIAKFPEVIKVVGKVGSAEIPIDPMPINNADMMIILKDKNEWVSAESYEELMEKMSLALEALPGVSFGFQYPVAMRFNELMSGARQDVVCKIFGENLDTLAHYAKQLGNICNTVEGSNDLYVEAVTGMSQIVIQYNRAAISQYGLNISDINKVVNAAFAGQVSGLVYEGEKRFDLVVRLGAEQRNELNDVENLLIPITNGNQIPLNAVAKVEIVEGPNQIQRENSYRRIVVGFNVRGRDVESIVNELKKKTENEIKLPPGYYINYGGTFENLQAAKKRLSIAVPVSLLLILLMLYFAFNSVRQGLLIYSAIPLSAIGGILALFIRDMPFSISAGIGFIALFGVSVLNGIVLVAEFNRLKNEGMDDLKRIVIQGTKIRLRPVLMTATVASLGFLPMALSNGEGAEVQRPLASVVIGGLLIATFLTLFVLPILYILFEKINPVNKKSISTGSILTLFISLFLFANNSNAQTPISLQGAIDTALKNNLTLKSEKINASYLQKIKASALSIPQTNIAYDYGQINSIYLDNKISVSQNFKFPTIYIREKNLLTEKWKNGLIKINIKENELKKQVSNIYFEILTLNQKKKLLHISDSIFSGFLHRAELRFDKGENNILEKITAETQKEEINLQVRELEYAISILQLKFKLLLNTNSDFVLSDEIHKLKLPQIADTSIVSSHPFIKSIIQKQQIGLANFKLEKSKLLPDVFASYNSMTIKGIGADEKLYGESDRFQSFQIGVGIPIFFGSQKATINASKINWQETQNAYFIESQMMKSEYQQAIIAYNKILRTVDYYEKSGNKNANLIMKTAELQFQNGAINYLEYVMLINKGISIQNEYIDSIKQLNLTIIFLNSFNNK